MIYDTRTKIVSATTNQAGDFEIQTASQFLQLNSVTAQSNKVGTKTDYKVSFNNNDSVINSNDEIWVDWPADISSSIGSTDVPCGCTVNRETFSTKCQFMEESAYKRMVISDLPTIEENVEDVECEFKNVRTPRNRGITE
mmetsp:Transcript_26521/g.4629  ORF Transcript_26521/g.4629 Transcript_26521/m.4629 type:complete len:140 (+) Transcript_26521:328-747(+)|eukprot:CAMPEP_0168313536 /NCGR_PEP_ID=MMETSP0210-20121227/2565_1 /TAXON_ID=40633 /ORGANISM="Condylostoma magnum, Strain COL2" /LENGTH=139 /DNA_ID=CAMNT_0008271243 /DNA_START=23376 /DNA_END=23795 /DNA_ORIENTATION=+